MFCHFSFNRRDSTNRKENLVKTAAWISKEEEEEEEKERERELRSCFATFNRRVSTNRKENLVKTAAWLSKEEEEDEEEEEEEEEMSIINKARQASFVRFSISISLVINSFVLSLLLSFIRPAF